MMSDDHQVEHNSAPRMALTVHIPLENLVDQLVMRIREMNMGLGSPDSLTISGISEEADVPSERGSDPMISVAELTGAGALQVPQEWRKSLKVSTGLFDSTDAEGE